MACILVSFQYCSDWSMCWGASCNQPPRNKQKVLWMQPRPKGQVHVDQMPSHCLLLPSKLETAMHLEKEATLSRYLRLRICRCNQRNQWQATATGAKWRRSVSSTGNSSLPFALCMAHGSEPDSANTTTTNTATQYHNNNNNNKKHSNTIQPHNTTPECVWGMHSGRTKH